jgi:alpha-galactosidase
MEFGIWVEPEMVNPDSDLFRAHPEWVLADPGYEPVLGRHQLVLDLSDDGAYEEILTRLDALLSDHDIAFVKWDMNRDHVHASGSTGRAGTHAQTLALYRLLDELRRRHPDVEIESCSSGGARIDLGILQRTERVWTSDCNDAVERQTIQRHASMLIPPEVMGAHVGPPTAHTTGRTQALAMRAATALFGHFGIEWNLLDVDDRGLADLAGWVALYKRHRELLHHGDVVRVDHDDPHALVHGVIASDRRRALVAYVQLSSAPALLPRPVRIPELEPDATYRVGLVDQPGGPPPGRRLTRGAAALRDGIELTGRQLAAHGVRLPVVTPESVELLWIEVVEMVHQ